MFERDHPSSESSNIASSFFRNISNASASAFSFLASSFSSWRIFLRSALVAAVLCDLGFTHRRCFHHSCKLISRRPPVGRIICIRASTFPHFWLVAASYTGLRRKCLRLPPVWLSIDYWVSASFSTQPLISLGNIPLLSSQSPSLIIRTPAKKEGNPPLLTEAKSGRLNS
jgi:hypothetical protein